MLFRSLGAYLSRTSKPLKLDYGFSQQQTTCFFFQAEDGIRDWSVTGVQTCALPIWCESDVGEAWAAAGVLHIDVHLQFFAGVKRTVQEDRKSVV